MRSFRAAVIAVGLSLAMAPVPAAAQYNLGGFVGPVTLTHYGYVSNGVYDEGCPNYLCLDAVIASGQDASGRFFARLVRFDPTFDVAAFNGPSVIHVDFDVLWGWLSYQEPVPTDPEEGMTGFDPGEAPVETFRHGSPVIPGRIDVEYVESHLAYDGAWMEFGGDWIAGFEPTSVTRVTAAPEPTTVALLGGGLLALGGFGAVRRRRS